MRSLLHIVSLPKSLLAFLWCQLVKGLGFISTKESIMVIVKILGIIMDLVAELGVVVNPVLLLSGFA